jgi:HNH endonuclease
MSSSYVPAALRQLVTARACGKCEYCRFPQAAALFSFQVEHIISEKHDGLTESENLALACPCCNRFKGSDLGSIDIITKTLTPFFNPRTERWLDHFQMETSGRIVPLTPEGRVTARILQFNDAERVSERSQFIALIMQVLAEE